jgi:hypothetical protein
LERRVVRATKSRDDLRPSASLANDYWILIDAAGQTQDFRVDRSGRLRSSVRPVGLRRAMFLLARSNEKTLRKCNRKSS